MVLQAQALPGVFVDRWDIPEAPTPQDTEQVRKLESSWNTMESSSAAKRRTFRMGGEWSFTSPMPETDDLSLPSSSSLELQVPPPPHPSGLRPAVSAGVSRQSSSSFDFLPSAALAPPSTASSNNLQV